MIFYIIVIINLSTSFVNSLIIIIIINIFVSKIRPKFLLFPLIAFLAEIPTSCKRSLCQEQASTHKNRKKPFVRTFSVMSEKEHSTKISETPPYAQKISRPEIFRNTEGFLYEIDPVLLDKKLLMKKRDTQKGPLTKFFSQSKNLDIFL